MAKRKSIEFEVEVNVPEEIAVKFIKDLYLIHPEKLNSMGNEERDRPLITGPIEGQQTP